MAPKEAKEPAAGQKTMLAFFSKVSAPPKKEKSVSKPATQQISPPLTGRKPTASASSSAQPQASTSKASPNLFTPPPTSDGDALSAPIAGSSRSAEGTATMQVDEDEDDDDEMPSQKGKARAKKRKQAVLDSDDEAEDSSTRPSKAAAKPVKSKKPRTSEDGALRDLVGPTHADGFFDDELDADLASMDQDVIAVSSDPPTPAKAEVKPKPKARPAPKPVQKTLDNRSASGSGSAVPKSKKGKTKASANTEESAFPFVIDRRDSEGRRPDDPDFDKRTLMIKKSEWEDLSPMEKQFWSIKKDRMDTFLFFQKGKFFELYEEDARIAHREFDLKLTDRVKMAMVGVPEGNFDLWATRFLSRGYKVGRVEQAETALGQEMRSGKKDIVHRELKHVLTQGTQVDNLDDDLSRHCIAIVETLANEPGASPVIGLCVLDAAIAEFQLAWFHDDVPRTKLETALRQLRPLEIIFEKATTATPHGLSLSTMRVLKNTLSPDCIWTGIKAGEQMCGAEQTLERLREVLSGKQDEEEMDTDVAVELPEVIESLKERDEVMSALGGMLWYLRESNLEVDLVTARNFLHYDPMRDGGNMALDGQTLAHIEVLQNSHGTDEGTLLRMLNRCVTPYGKRLFKQWLCAPLRSVRDINARLDTVEDLIKSKTFQPAFESQVKKMGDLERLISRVHAGSCKPKDFAKLLGSFKKLAICFSTLKSEVEDFKSDELKSRLASVPDLEPIVERIEAMFSLSDDDVLTPNDGADEDFDNATKATIEIETKLQALLRKYKQELDCTSIAFKDVGTKEIYQLEVPADQKVPSNWEKKSSTKKVNRYYTPELEKRIRKLKEARETLEAAVKGFKKNLYAAFDEHYSTWLKACKTAAAIDCLLSLAKASASLGYPSCRPEVIEAPTAFLDFEELRHPCVLVDSFIPNDVTIGDDAKTTILLTGPNMAGKSTLLRMTCIATIMAQLGMYVPASRARISPVDRINTRMGANDAIFSNASTFKVELDDTSKIMAEATPRSLVILDELGRGTSTWDGMAIAFAVLHHLATHVGCLTMFSTHYSQLVEDMAYHPQVRPMHMLIHEDPDESHVVNFTYKLGDGAAKGSFGPSVAKLAGLDPKIVARAVSISKDMQEKSQLKEAELRQRETMNLAKQADFAWLFEQLSKGKYDVKDPDQLGRTLAIIADGFLAVQ